HDDNPKPKTLQNQRQSKTNLYPNTTTNAPRLPSDQGFCSPSNHVLHLLYTCFPLPAEETETEQACKYHGVGPRSVRVVTQHRDDGETDRTGGKLYTHTHTH